MNWLVAILLASPAPDTGPAPDGGGGGGGMLGGLLPFFIILIAVMLFAPLFNKKEKHRQTRLKTLKKHDEVVTSGGVYGTIVTMDEKVVTLQIAKEVRIKVRRSSIYDLAQEPEPEQSAQKGAKAGAKG
ncbi:MAG: preprotein translocase subunit YajC [Planctomycetota bacterium]|nr:preprotein translocase subunit YajC [Planctomycetota bacterium]